MRLLLIILCSLSFFSVFAQTDEILLEPNVFKEVDIKESDLEVDIFFDAEGDDVIQVSVTTSITEGYFDVTGVAVYSPEGDELTQRSNFFSPEIHLEPYRIKASGRYRIHIITRKSAQVDVRYKVRETPDFADSYSLQDSLYNTVGFLDFTFIAEEGEIITSYVLSRSFDAVLTLYDPDGEIIASDDDSLGDLNPEISQFKIPTSGKYRLVVHSYNPDDDGLFTIFVKVNPIQSDDYIAYDEAVSLSFDGQTTLYAFQFDGSAGDVIALDVDDPEAIADLRIEGSSEYGRVIATTDESATSLYSKWDKIVLPSNYSYRLYITAKDETIFGDVVVKVEHLASNSLEAGAISVHLSEKNPIHLFTFPGYYNASATITINQDNYDAATMPYRITLMNDRGEIFMAMTIDDFIGTFSQTNIFGTGRLPNGEVTLRIEMLGQGPAWFDVSVEVVSGMG